MGLSFSKAKASNKKSGRQAAAVGEIPHSHLLGIVAKGLLTVKAVLLGCVNVGSGLAQLTSFHGKAGPSQELVEAVGDGFAVGAAAVVVEEDDGGIVGPLVGGGYPIPTSAAGGSKAKAGAQLFLIRQFVEGFGVQGLETINRPAFGPPAFLAGLLGLETG